MPPDLGELVSRAPAGCHGEEDPATETAAIHGRVSAWAQRGLRGNSQVYPGERRFPKVMRSNLLAMACVWGAVACDGPGSAKPGKEPESARPPVQQPSGSPNSPAPPAVSGPDAPATITQKRWVELQLTVAKLDSAVEWEGVGVVSTGVSGNAVSVDLRRARPPTKLAEDRQKIAEAACWMLAGVDLPGWVTELHLSVVEPDADTPRRSKKTVSRVAMSSVKVPCLMEGIEWSTPVWPGGNAPDPSGVPLSTPRQD